MQLPQQAQVPDEHAAVDATSLAATDGGDDDRGLEDVDVPQFVAESGHGASGGDPNQQQPEPGAQDG